MIPVSWLLRKLLRWMAFRASVEQINYICALCAGAIPIAQSALEAARLREVYARACDEGACTPALQRQVDDVTAFVEDATAQALSSLLAAMDANGDGKVSLAEVRDAWQAQSDAEERAGASAGDAATVASLLEAMNRVQGTVADLDRLQYSINLAVEGAVAAIDEDGDGKITLQEAVQAPRRIADWMGVWRELLERGKL